MTVIGKIPDRRRDGGSSFRDLVAYCTTKDPSKVLHVGCRRVMSPETAAIEMEALATDNTRCKDPVFHMILAWREMEIPTSDQVDEAVHVALKELDLQNCQALWALHNDTQNRHVHIVVNRIDPDTGKAIIPANGWTYKALERAARKIELAQGWESEQSGFYRVTEDGELIEKPRRKEPAISTSARDIEAHTAAKSAERVAREVAAPIIRSAKSWKELHGKLAEQGIAFERKGSGAVLVIGETIVKASKAGRDLSLSKLEARLGSFLPRPEEIRITARSTEPIKRVEERKVKSEWERYTAERELYFREKKETALALSARQKAERAELQKRQREERESMFSGSWKGRGALLNRQRSILAATQQVEKLNLRDRHDRECDDLKKLFPIRFPNFKTWLDIEEINQEASVSFRYPQNAALHGNEAMTDAVKADLRAFTPKISGRGGVAYARDGGKEADFIDYGKKIVLAEKCGEAAILAALQLANQKWGSAVINGTEEYKRKFPKNLKVYKVNVAISSI